MKKIIIGMLFLIVSVTLYAAVCDNIESDEGFPAITNNATWQANNTKTIVFADGVEGTIYRATTADGNIEYYIEVESQKWYYGNEDAVTKAFYVYKQCKQKRQKGFLR